MKFLIAWIVSNILYGMGHVVSRLLHIPDEWHREWWAWPVFKAYQHLMSASVDVNDWGNAGVWRKVEPVELMKEREGE